MNTRDRAGLFILLTVASLRLTAASAAACLWDRDTLANEARGIPDVLAVIAGRFPRNPPRYYSMRLERVTRDIAKSPERLDLYADAAVAADHLGDDNAAITWMVRERQQLAAQHIGEGAQLWYPYWANLGTFVAHRWLRSGANRAQMGEMKRAREMIARAIRINPNAHFGREKVQLWMMDAIIQGRHSASADADDVYGSCPGDARGICGLIVLGSAWESVDAFLALTAALKVEPEPGSRPGLPLLDNPPGSRGRVAMLALLRAMELVREGHTSLLLNPRYARTARALRVLSEFRPRESFEPDDNAAQFAALRAEAERWQSVRTAHMERLFAAGRHPDTDSAFWSGFIEPPLPAAYAAAAHRRDRRREVGTGAAAVILCILLRGVAMRRRRAARVGRKA